MSRPPRDWWLFCQASVAITSGRAALLIFPLGSVRRILRWLLRSEHPFLSDRAISADRVIRAVVPAATHSPVGSTCLCTALVAQAMLERHGHQAKLRVGVRRGGSGEFAAHAWLERDGRVVVGGPVSDIAGYTPMPEMEHLIR